jgi:hypothetical protein
MLGAVSYSIISATEEADSLAGFQQKQIEEKRVESRRSGLYLLPLPYDESETKMQQSIRHYFRQVAHRFSSGVTTPYSQ